jgi:PleD family two-component response regulator
MSADFTRNTIPVNQTTTPKSQFINLAFNGKNKQEEILYMGPPTRTKIIFYQINSAIYSNLSHKLVEKGYICEELSSPEATLPSLKTSLYQIILVIFIQDNLPASTQTLLRQIQSHGLSDSVVVMAVLPNSLQLSQSLFSSLLSAGVSRVGLLDFT